MRGVTDIVRVCKAAEYIAPTIIRSLHTSHVMAGEQRVDDGMLTLATTELCASVAHYIRAICNRRYIAGGPGNRAPRVCEGPTRYLTKGLSPSETWDPVFGSNGYVKTRA